MKLSISEIRKTVRDQIVLEYKKALNEVDAEQDSDEGPAFEDHITDQESGDAFRVWVNDNHTEDAQKKVSAGGLDLDRPREGLKTRWNNSYIKRAWKRYGAEFLESKRAAEIEEGWTFQFGVLLQSFKDELEKLGNNPSDQAEKIIELGQTDQEALIDLFINRRDLRRHLDKVLESPDAKLFEKVAQDLVENNQESFFETMGQVAAIGYTINAKFRAYSQELWLQIQELKNVVQLFNSGELRKREMDGYDEAQKVWNEMTQSVASEERAQGGFEAAVRFDLINIAMHERYLEFIQSQRLASNVASLKTPIQSLALITFEMSSKKKQAIAKFLETFEAKILPEVEAYVEDVNIMLDDARELVEDIQAMHPDWRWGDSKTPWGAPNVFPRNPWKHIIQSFGKLVYDEIQLAGRGGSASASNAALNRENAKKMWQGFLRAFDVDGSKANEVWRKIEGNYNHRSTAAGLKWNKQEGIEDLIAAGESEIRQGHKERYTSEEDSEEIDS